MYLILYRSGKTILESLFNSIIPATISRARPNLFVVVHNR
jgi:hypothetical protein